MLGKGEGCSPPLCGSELGIKQGGGPMSELRSGKTHIVNTCVIIHILLFALIIVSICL